MSPQTPGPGAPHATAPFVVRLVTNGDHSVAALIGELDMTGTERLDSLVDDLLHNGHRRVILDMPRLDFIDAAGLGVLARAHTDFREAGGTLVVAGARPQHHRLLELVGLLPILEDR